MLVMSILLILALLVSISAFLVLKVNKFVWLLAFAVFAVLFKLALQLSATSCYVIFFSYAIIALVFGVESIRRNVLSKLIFVWFKKVLPPMSQTEKEAIEAGDTAYEANLFQGNLNWSEFLSKPGTQLTNEENEFLHNQVETLCSMLDDWNITHETYDLPQNAWEYIKKEKFFSLLIPKEYGGLDFSATANSTIVMKIATRSLSAAVTVMVPNSLGPAELLLKYGSREQKQEYLPKLANGEHVPCFGLTGVDAGSDASAISDSGIICKGTFEGKEVIGAKLTWNKRYITLAPVASLLGLAVKLYDPDGVLGAKEELGITVFLLPTNISGVEVGRRHFPLNQSFMNGPTRGKDVFVPLSFIVGGQKNVGKGWIMLTECLAAGRGISLPALGTAMAKLCFRTTSAYAKLRKQFGVSIGKFEGVSSALARIGGLTYMMESARLLTVESIDEGSKPSVLTAIAKYHMTEIGRQIINDSMDIHGGRGIIMGRRNYLARLFQGTPIAITVEGANILTRCLIIFGQGAIRCHPFTRQEIEAAQNEDYKKGLEDFDRAFFGHAYYTLSNLARLKLHNYTGMLFIGVPKLDSKKFKGLNEYFRTLSFFSLALASVADMAMLMLGGDLKRKENLSARLGDVLSYLYLGASVIKYYNDFGERESDLPFVRWSLKFCIHRIQNAFEGFFDNFPNRFMAFSLRLLVTPFWRHYSPPNDKLDIELSESMMRRTDFRERICSDTYFAHSSNDPVGRVELAFYKMLEAEPLLAKIDKAVKQGVIPKTVDNTVKIKIALDENLISNEEAGILRDFESARLDAMQVDEFTNEELIRSE